MQADEQIGLVGHLLELWLHHIALMQGNVMQGLVRQVELTAFNCMSELTSLSE